MTNKELRELVEIEGDLYSAMQAVSPGDIEDVNVRYLWIKAKNALDDLEGNLYSE